MSLEIDSGLRSLLARSSDCVWRHDPEGYAQCWASDGEWRLKGEVIRGREAIAARWSASMRRYTRVWQESHNVAFAVDRDRPVGRLHLKEYLIPRDSPAVVLKGVYDDEYTFEDGAWRFAVRDLDIAYIGPLDLSGTWHPRNDHGSSPDVPLRTGQRGVALSESNQTGHPDPVV